MLNGQHVEEPEEENGDDDAVGLLDFLPASEVGRRIGYGRRFVVTLHQQGHVRRRQAGSGWHYCVQDAEAYKEASGAAKPKGVRERTEYESELQTLVTGYKELLGLQNAALKQAQQHERELFAAFTQPLGVLTAAMQAQVGQLTERANAGDTARVDFIVATETMLKDQRAEHAEQERAEATRTMRVKMWDDVKRAAPHVWAGVQKTMGLDPSVLERLRAGETLKEKLDKTKVAALFAFDLLSDEEKTLLCTAFGYDREELEAMARDAGAHDVATAEESAPEATDATE